MKLKNKRILITGGTEGLGLALVKNLIEKDSQIIVCARTKENLEKIKKELKEIETHQCDVSDYSQVEKMIKETGQIDILINAAGVYYDGQLEDHTIEQIDQQIDINLKGTIYTCKAILPQMKKRQAGCIVNVSSTSGIKGKPNHSAYVASKWGVTGLTKSLQIDLKDSKVKVLGFYPGGMKTNLFEDSKKSAGADWMDPNKVAEIIVFMIERDESMIMDHVVVNRRSK